ncbi:DUF4097 family beta strand repeat-containing protein [Saccharopolyspora griseoalba]|uniref:DUF4097 domain-containing protein n=1 Tax=Saccharopolyspora griseoalba TaxID=1431848 RepID=A0ABW2LG75_9PSEU
MSDDERARYDREPGEERSSAEEQLSELVRSQDFDTDAPLRIDVSNTVGPISIELTDTAVTHVEVRHDPNAAGPDWRDGLTNLLSWVTEQFGEPGRAGSSGPDLAPESADPGTAAVRRTRVDLSGGRLVVRTPSQAPLRSVPLAVKVQAPKGSEVTVHSGSGEAEITGTAGRVSAQSGSGTVTIAEATDRASVRSGAGQLRLGSMRGGLHARTGNGDIEVSAIEAASSVATGSGNVWLGVVSGDVMVRSGSGDLTVADATEGQLELITGSGELQVSIHRGTTAEVDLTSSTGNARSDLDVTAQPPEQEPGLRVFGRTGTGSAVLTTAT